jgi:hypothetical protein
MENQSGPTSALRIYLGRDDVKQSLRWGQRSVKEALSHYLVRSAKQSGIEYAVVNLSHSNRGGGATKDRSDHRETPQDTPSGCVEFLPPNHLLEQFIRDEAKYLQNKTLVMLEGAHISGLTLTKIDQLIESRPHSVERIRGTGETELTIEHVNADELEEENEGQEREEEEGRRRINAATCI